MAPHYDGVEAKRYTLNDSNEERIFGREKRYPFCTLVFVTFGLNIDLL